MKSLLQYSIKASLQAGQKILEIYNKGEDYTIDYKSDDSPLTIADSESHRIITEIIDEGNFGIPVLSEEGSHLPYRERKNWTRLWIIDPLDGTKEFINRNGEFTVNIALVENGKPVLGVIYLPVQQILYYASEGEGARKVKLTTGEAAEFSATASNDSITKNAVIIRAPVNHHTNSKPVSIVASRSHLNEKTKQLISRIKNKYNDISLVSAGSSLKICLVAEATADIYPRLAPTMEWDTAAGHAIATEAGCRMIQFENMKPLEYNKENLRNPEFLVLAPWIETKI